jgi:hypothetical protein
MNGELGHRGLGAGSPGSREREVEAARTLCRPKRQTRRFTRITGGRGGRNYTSEWLAVRIDNT